MYSYQKPVNTVFYNGVPANELPIIPVSPSTQAVYMTNPYTGVRTQTGTPELLRNKWLSQANTAMLSPELQREQWLNNGGDNSRFLELMGQPAKKTSSGGYDYSKSFNFDQKNTEYGTDLFGLGTKKISRDVLSQTPGGFVFGSRQVQLGYGNNMGGGGGGFWGTVGDVAESDEFKRTMAAITSGAAGLITGGAGTPLGAGMGILGTGLGAYSGQMPSGENLAIQAALMGVSGATGAYDAAYRARAAGQMAKELGYSSAAIKAAKAYELATVPQYLKYLNTGAKLSSIPLNMAMQNQAKQDYQGQLNARQDIIDRMKSARQAEQKRLLEQRQSAESFVDLLAKRREYYDAIRAEAERTNPSSQWAVS